MSRIKLSICIPTRNFGAYIGETLASLKEQCSEAIEIVIVDSGSTDNTEETVLGYTQDIPNLRYHKYPVADGIDKDLSKAISLAKGEYCWPLSADDIVKPKAINAILQNIDLGFDTLIFNRTECDKWMNIQRNCFFLEKSVQSGSYDFSSAASQIEYFSQARSLAAVFSYISSIIFRHNFWSDNFIESEPRYAHYMLAAILLRGLTHGGQHRYIRDSLIFCRGGNDSFLEQSTSGIVKRYMIDFDGYYAIGSDLAIIEPTRKVFLRILTHEHRFVDIVRLAIRLSDQASWLRTRTKLANIGYRATILSVASITRLVEKKMNLFYALRALKNKIRAG